MCAIDGVYLVFFLHVTTRIRQHEQRAGVLIATVVTAGSLWIVANLNNNMMAPAELMNLRM